MEQFPQKYDYIHRKKENYNQFKTRMFVATGGYIYDIFDTNYVSILILYATLQGILERTGCIVTWLSQDSLPPPLPSPSQLPYPGLPNTNLGDYASRIEYWFVVLIMTT